MKKKYPVILTDAQRERLKGPIAAGTAPARELTHARILLEADQSPQGPGWVDERVADAVEVSQPTVAGMREQYVREGPEAALNRRPPKRGSTSESSTGSRRPGFSRLPVANHPKAGLAGACGCWPTSWWSSRSWRRRRRRSPTRRSEGLRKKRTEGAPEEAVVDRA